MKNIPLQILLNTPQAESWNLDKKCAYQKVEMWRCDFFTHLKIVFITDAHKSTCRINFLHKRIQQKTSKTRAKIIVLLKSLNFQLSVGYKSLLNLFRLNQYYVCHACRNSVFRKYGLEQSTKVFSFCSINWEIEAFSWDA